MFMLKYLKLSLQQQISTMFEQKICNLVLEELKPCIFREIIVISKKMNWILYMLESYVYRFSLVQYMHAL